VCYQKIGASINLIKSKSSGEIGGGSSGDEVWRRRNARFFLERSLNEENNSTGVYKYISIRIPLDYIFDCIKKYILLIYYKP